MTCLDTLYNEILDNNISLFDYSIPHHNGATIKINEDYAIFIDYSKIETLSEEFLYTVHEYGHCRTGATHYLYSSLESKDRNEYLANKYSVHRFLPLETLEEAAEKGYKEIFEIADYLNIPEEFVTLAFDIYRREGKIT